MELKELKFFLPISVRQFLEHDQIPDDSLFQVVVMTENPDPEEYQEVKLYDAYGVEVKGNRYVGNGTAH